MVWERVWMVWQYSILLWVCSYILISPLSRSHSIVIVGGSVNILIKCLLTQLHLTSPEPLKNCHNFFILHQILKTLPPLESTHLSRSDDILYYT